MTGMGDLNIHVAAVLIQLGATDDEVERAWQTMKFWPMPDGPSQVIDDCRKALALVRETEPRCGAGESEFYDHCCTLHEGHEGWHQDWRGGRLWAEWRETWRPRGDLLE
jgi:hypothetical protein